MQQSTATSGSVAWGYDAGVNDNLTNGSGTLTSYGQEVAQWIASASSASDPTPSANDTVVKGTTGSVTDASGPTSTGTTTSPLPAATTPDAGTNAHPDTVGQRHGGDWHHAAITDASGNIWTITSGGQVAVNATAEPTTAKVIELAYVNSASLAGERQRPVVGQDQPKRVMGTRRGHQRQPAARGVPKRYDVDCRIDRRDHRLQRQHLDVTSGGQVAVNGTADTTTANVTELAYVNGEVWQENASNLWWGKTSPTAVVGTGGGHQHQPAAGSDHHRPWLDQRHGQPERGLGGATSGTNMMFISGSNDIVTLSGGTNTVTDTGTGNTYILPAAGKGKVTFTSDILNTGDTLDLKPALAATNWSWCGRDAAEAT